MRGKKKHTQIESELGLPGPEISRHLKRLQNIKLIQKATDGGYQLTNFGSFLCGIFPLFESGLNFMDFINSHDFGNIPLYLLIQLGSVPDIELRTMTMENIELWTNLVKTADSYIYAIIDQLQLSVIPTIQNKIQSGSNLEIKAIIDQELFKRFRKPENLPADVKNFRKQLKFFDNVRLSEKNLYSITVTDKGAIIFLRVGDAVDYNQGIFGKSPAFLKFTKKLFDYYWEQAKTFKPSDLLSEE